MISTKDDFEKSPTALYVPKWWPQKWGSGEPISHPTARCGVRTHASIRRPDLKSGALNHSANLAVTVGILKSYTAIR